MQVENLELLGDDNITRVGNKLSNTMVGNSGNNILDGGSGADTMMEKGLIRIWWIIRPTR